MDKKSGIGKLKSFDFDNVEKLILVYVTVLAALTGCKPQQVVKERYVLHSDSSLVATLREELNLKTVELMTLKTDISRMREENTRLQSEITTHVINYDTNAQLKSDGSYPVAQEIISSSKQKLERQLQERETLIQELNREVETLLTKNINLEYELQQLKDVEREREVEGVRRGWWRYFLVIAIMTGVLLIGVAVGWRSR